MSVTTYCRCGYTTSDNTIHYCPACFSRMPKVRISAKEDLDLFIWYLKSLGAITQSDLAEISTFQEEYEIQPGERLEYLLQSPQKGVNQECSFRRAEVRFQKSGQKTIHRPSVVFGNTRLIIHGGELAISLWYEDISAYVVNLSKRTLELSSIYQPDPLDPGFTLQYTATFSWQTSSWFLPWWRKLSFENFTDRDSDARVVGHHLEKVFRMIWKVAHDHQMNQR